MAMTALADTFRSVLSTVAQVVRRKAMALRNWYQARKDYRLLCAMDEAALSDIGLTRADLRDATAAGYFGDPTVVIAARAAERARHRRLVAVTRAPSLVPEATAGLPKPVACG
jgi:uncharacterized protein YjiS (DUF1127 family)